MTAVHTQAYPPSPSLISVDAPPSFTTTDNLHTTAIELRNLRLSSSSTSSVDSLDRPPTYSDAYSDNVAGASSSAPTTGSFHPTLQLQIETKGKPVLSLPVPLRPDPVPIFAVAADGTVEPQPRYVSVRRTRGSGSCTLYAGGDADASADASDNLGRWAAARPLSTTTYRFGPTKHPRVALFDPLAPPPAADKRHGRLVGPALQRDFDDGASDHQHSDADSHVEHHDDDDTNNDGEGDAEAWDAFEIQPRGLFTRAQTFRTRLGAFEWRYATRAERKAVGANSLLVLDRIVRVAHAQNHHPATTTTTTTTTTTPSSSLSPSTTAAAKVKNGVEEVRTPVAQLVRNAALRTPGSSGGSAGNGGRLLLDLGAWRDAKVEREVVEVLVVTTCISMLKKEVDRRRTQQIAVMAAVAGGAH